MTFIMGKMLAHLKIKELSNILLMHGSKSGQGTIGTDPRNWFISPFNAHHEAIIKKTEEIVGKDLNITAASLKIYIDGEKEDNNLVKVNKLAL